MKEQNKEREQTKQKWFMVRIVLHIYVWFWNTCWICVFLSINLCCCFFLSNLAWEWLERLEIQMGETGIVSAKNHVRFTNERGKSFGTFLCTISSPNAKNMWHLRRENSNLVMMINVINVFRKINRITYCFSRQKNF